MAAIVLASGCERAAPAPSAGAAAKQTTIAADKIDASLDAAQKYISSQQWDKGQAILMTLIDRAPREVRARELYGQMLIHMALDAQSRGEAEAAQKHRAVAYEQYRAAAELQPESAGLQHSAGVVAMEAGKPDDALRHFATAAGLDPTSAQYPLFAAQIHIQRKRFDEAAREVERALSLDPDEPIAHASMAIILMEQGDLSRSLEHMLEARRITPNDVGLRAQQARIHRRMGEPKRALELLIGLPERERALEVVAFELASSYHELGEHRNAAMAWVNRYRANPTDARAHVAAANAAELFLEAGEKDAARMWLRQAQIGGANDPQIRALEQALQ